MNFFDDADNEDFDAEAEDKRIENLPVYKKAENLFELTQTICDVIDEEKDVLHMREMMLGNAMTIPAKIAGAEGGDLYSIRFDNATLIKLSARELLAQTSALRREKLIEEKYIDMFRKEIEEFRILFLEWVKSFDKTNDISDEWDIKNL